MKHLLLILMMPFSNTARCAGPLLTTEQIQSAIRDGSRYKTRDSYLDKTGGYHCCLLRKYPNELPGLSGKRVKISGALAGVSKYVTFFNDRGAVAAEAAGASQQMRTLSPGEIRVGGLLHAHLAAHSRGGVNTGKIDRLYGGSRPHMVLKVGDRIIQPLTKAPVQAMGLSGDGYHIGFADARRTTDFVYDVTPADLESPVEVIIIDGDGDKHTAKADLRGILDID